MSLAAGTPCYVNNAHPGIKVGTPVVLLNDCFRVHAETVMVRTESGKVHIVASLSLSAMLPEEIPAWAKP